MDRSVSSKGCKGQIVQQAGAAGEKEGQSFLNLAMHFKCMFSLVKLQIVMKRPRSEISVPAQHLYCHRLPSALVACCQQSIDGSP